MTKEITKAFILQQLQDKLKLREFEPTPFLFSEEVVPIYDIGQHLKNHYLDIKTMTISSASGFIFYTVPFNEKWTLSRYMVVFLGAGAIKIAGVSITRKNAATGAFLYLDLTKNQTVSYAVNLPIPVALDPGDKIIITCDDYTSTQDLKLYIDVNIEEIR